MKKYRAGVIGTRLIGKVHIETLRRLGNVDVVALTDKYMAKETAEELHVPNSFENYKEMIDTMSLDTVHMLHPKQHPFRDGHVCPGARSKCHLRPNR